jgi:hypothetical protein
MKEYVDANMEGKCNLYLETMFKLRYVILKEFVFNFFRLCVRPYRCVDSSWSQRLFWSLCRPYQRQKGI